MKKDGDAKGKDGRFVRMSPAFERKVLSVAHAEGYRDVSAFIRMALKDWIDYREMRRGDHVYPDLPESDTAESVDDVDSDD